MKDINSVLEIGCNEGLICLLFGMAGYKTRGIDISSECIKKFKRHYEYFASRSNETFVIDANCKILNLFDLPKTQHYDLVLIFKVIHHIPYSELHNVVNILKAIVAKGGYVLIQDPNRSGFPNFVFYLNWINGLLPGKLQCQFFKKRFTKTEFPIKTKDIIDLFSLSGFELLAFEYVKIDPIHQYAKLKIFNFIFRLLPKKLKALDIALLLKKVS